jgi:ABC-type dipeptide/oligopeptide/nickel transport system permease component
VWRVFSYFLRRVVALIPTLFGVSIAVFLLLHLVPGDPARMVAGLDATEADIALIRQDLGLDKSVPEQYLTWMGNLLKGDMGKSTRTRNPVTYEVGLRLPATWQLTAVSITIAVVIGLITGITAATRRNSLLDYSSMAAALLGICTPSFWLGLMLMLVFAVQLRWFPTSGRGDWRHLVLPGFTLGAGAAAIIARVTRSSLLEVLNQDYIRTATAKGLRSQTVIYRHALKNALIPVVTVVGLEFGYLLAGAVITETVFAYPGIGRLLVDSIGFRDFPVVQGILLILAFQFVMVNLGVDLLYAWLDPRIHYDNA